MLQKLLNEYTRKNGSRMKNQIVRTDKITGFHIDMNMAQFNAQYLKQWLREIAASGYNTIIWEVENNIKWQTCPECVSPDAFSKEEFKDIIKFSRDLGLAPVPLLQTLGHCEYVLKHDKYKHLAEVDGSIMQYCPQNEELQPFLTSWIDEYLEIFGDVDFFHIGADETVELGCCDKCKRYVANHSLSQLYVQYVNRISLHLTNQNITPIIWADMLLAYPEAIEKLSREIVFTDWRYDIYRGNGKIFVWGKGWMQKGEIDAKTLKRFGDFIFPSGDEAGREPETFYTADYLAHAGFRVITCPASASYLDSVFAPQNYYHIANTFDTFIKGQNEHLGGSILTSWTVHLFPYELQLASIDVPSFIKQYPDETIDSYLKYFVGKRFGTDDSNFVKACGYLSKPCLFSWAQSLGFWKNCEPVPISHICESLLKLAEDGKICDELNENRKRLAEYRKGLELLKAFSDSATKGQEYLKYWDLAARNLINRARAAIHLLQNKFAEENELMLDVEFQKQGKKILKEMQCLREETHRMYENKIKPERCEEIRKFIYASLEHALVVSTRPTSP